VLRLAALTIAIAGSAALAASAPVQAPHLFPAQTELRQARQEAAAAQAEERRLTAEAAAARDEASRLRAQQLAAAQAIAAAEAQISAADVNARLVQAQLAAKRRTLEAEQAPVRSLLAGLVVMGRKPPLLLLADGGSAHELVRLQILLRSTMPAMQAKTAALKRQLDGAARLEQAAIDARNERMRTRDDLAQRKQEFARLEARAVELAQRRGTQALGAGDIALASEERSSALEREAESGRSIAQVARELAELGPAPLAHGEQVQPAPLKYQLPASASVIDGLGEISENGVRSRGVTLATRRGASLTVPASGTIIFAGPFRDYDGVIIIDHGSGWKSVVVNAGTRLARGAPVHIGEPLGIALGPVEVQLQHRGAPVSPALIAGSSQMLSNVRKGG